VEHGTDVVDGLAAGTIILQLPEVFLHVVGTQGGDSLLADGILDVEFPDALVPTGGRRAEIIPAVGLPSANCLVDSGGRSPRPAGLVGDDLGSGVLFED